MKIDIPTQTASYQEFANAFSRQINSNKFVFGFLGIHGLSGTIGTPCEQPNRPSRVCGNIAHTMVGHSQMQTLDVVDRTEIQANAQKIQLKAPYDREHSKRTQNALEQFVS